MRTKPCKIHASGILGACTALLIAAAPAAAAVDQLGQSAIGPNPQRCDPTNTTHRVIVRLPGVTVSEQTCAIRFVAQAKVKAWVHTEWRRTSNRTRFRSYVVQTRLQFRNLTYENESLHCRYAALINRSRTGSGTCETTARIAASTSRLYTGDGAVDYNTGNGVCHRELQGSPAV